MKLPQTARRVVITGMSAISPLGSSWADVRSALLHNRSGVQHMTKWEDLQGLNTRVGAPAAPFELDPEFFTRKRTRSMGRVAQMAVKTARDALREDLAPRRIEGLANLGRVHRLRVDALDVGLGPPDVVLQGHCAATRRYAGDAPPARGG